MGRTVLDPLDAINLAFAFEMVDSSEVPAAEQPEASKLHEERSLFILYINPEEFSFQKPEAATVIPAQGGVFADDLGFATGRITLRGRLGAKRRIAHNRFGEKDLLSGHEQLLEFDGFLDEYRNRRASGANVELRFHAYRYDVHYAVVPLDFSFQKNRRTRIGSPLYTLQLQTYRRLDDAPSSVLGDILGGIGFVAGFAEDAVTGLAITLAEARALGSVGLLAPNQLDPLLTSAEAFVDEAQRSQDVVLAVRRIGVAQLTRLQNALAQLLNALGKSLHESPDDSGSARALYRILTAQETHLNILERSAGQVSDAGGRGDRWARQLDNDSSLTQSEASALAVSAYADGDEDVDGAGRPVAAAERVRRAGSGAPQVSQRAFNEVMARFDRYSGWVPYQISEHDTIYSVAVREYGASDQWMDIVLANNLSPPYFGRGMGVAEPGDLIRLPTFGAQPSIPFDLSIEDFPEFNADIERRIFGVDWKLVEVGAEKLLDFKVSADGLDLEEIEGLDCFVQRLGLIVLRTELGSNILFPRVGVAYRIGDPNLPGHSILLLLSLREALSSESAVRRIQNEIITQDGTGTFVEYDIDAFAAGQVKIRRAVR